MSTVETQYTAVPCRPLAVRPQCKASWVYSCSVLGDIKLTKRVLKLNLSHSLGISLHELFVVQHHCVPCFYSIVVIGFASDF